MLIFVYFSTHQSDLEELLTNWSEDRSIGDVILNYVSLVDAGLKVSHYSAGIPTFDGHPPKKCMPVHTCKYTNWQNPLLKPFVLSYHSLGTIIIEYNDYNNYNNAVFKALWAKTYFNFE